MNLNRCALAFAIICCTQAAHAQTAPRVEAAWARPTVAGQAAGGGYLKIIGGSTPDRLLSASAGVAKAVEMHTMEMDGSVMRMRQMDGIDVPAGQAVALMPGGKHIMFMGLTQPLKVGDSFPLTLRFQKAGEVKVNVKVMTGAAPMGGRDGHMP